MEDNDKDDNNNEDDNNDKGISALGPDLYIYIERERERDLGFPPFFSFLAITPVCLLIEIWNFIVDLYILADRSRIVNHTFLF